MLFIYSVPLSDPRYCAVHILVHYDSVFSYCRRVCHVSPKLLECAVCIFLHYKRVPYVSSYIMRVGCVSPPSFESIPCVSSYCMRVCRVSLPLDVQRIVPAL